MLNSRAPAAPNICTLLPPSFVKAHWRERKNKISNFGNVQNLEFSFFSRPPQPYSPKQESFMSNGLCYRNNV